MTSNEWGTMVEGMFSEGCGFIGVECVRPERMCAWDFLVGRGGFWRRVQVKGVRSVTRHGRSGDYVGRAHMVRNSGRGSRKGLSYFESGVDVMAIFVEPWRQWYIFQLDATFPKKLEVRRTPTGRLKDAVNNWGLFLK